MLMATAIQITCSLPPVIIIFKNKGSVCGFAEMFSSREETAGGGETDCGKNLLQKQRYTQGSGIKLSLASSSRHFVVLTCTRTRRRVAERG